MISAALGQDAARAQEPTPTLVIQGGSLFDPESAATRPFGQLWIAGDRILGEHPASTPPPRSATLVDANGCTLLPGLFDLHVHVAVSGGGMGGGVMLQSTENLETALAFGVTHVVDLHNAPELVFPLRERARKEPGFARLLAAGAAFTAPKGHGTQFGIEANAVTSIEEVGARFEKLLTWKPDVVKAIVEHGGWGPVPKMPALEEPLLAEVGRRALAAKLPLFVHVWTLDEANLAVRSGADVLAHGVYVGAIDDELLQAMKQRDVAYTPTLAVVLGARRVAKQHTPYTVERVGGLLHPDLVEALNDSTAITWSAQWKEADEKLFFANLKRVFDAGLRVGVGTDAGNPMTPHGPAVLFEISLFVEAGIPPAQALRCATLESAKIVHREKEFGSLAAGKVADVVVVRGDPAADVNALWKIERVFKAGREVDREALRRRNAERAAPKPPPAALKAGEGVPATVDDFDDGDLVSLWGGEWSAVSDKVAPGGKSTATVEIAEGDSGGHLLLKGALAEGFPYGPFAGVQIQWDPTGTRLVDVSAMKNLVLRIRGTPRTYTISLDRAAVKDFNLFAAVLPVKDEWEEVRLPLSSFQQIGFGKSIPTAWNDLKGLGIQARNGQGGKPQFGEFELEIDWIRFE